MTQRDYRVPNYRVPDYRVIVGLTYGRLGGVDTFAINLVHGLMARGIPSQILLTEDAGSAADALPFPSDVPVERLPVSTMRRWPERWRVMTEYLESLAPCIYLPNYDWKHSCVAPCLSDRVGIVGVLHSDDPDHYEHVARMGTYWNAVATVSPAITTQVAASHPELVHRLSTLPYGVPVPSELPERPSAPDAPLRIIYSGRIAQYQKRALDIPKIIAAALGRGAEIELSVLGTGVDEPQFRADCEQLAGRCRVRFFGNLPNADVLAHYARNDVFLLPSEFEGLPLSLLEAMGNGCVPVVSDIRSGIPDLVDDGVNGFVVPIGDIAAFGDRLAQLHRDASLRSSMAPRAHEAVKLRECTVDDMTRRYVEVFERVWDDVDSGRFRRPAGEITPPGWMKPLWKHYLPGRVRDMAGPLYFALNGKPAPVQ